MRIADSLWDDHGNGPQSGAIMYLFKRFRVALPSLQAFPNYMLYCGVPLENPKIQNFKLSETNVKMK